MLILDDAIAASCEYTTPSAWKFDDLHTSAYDLGWLASE
jgi:hypothetical protein